MSMQKNASTFVAGLVSSNPSYNLTILTNHQGVEKILNRDSDFINDLLKKISFESKKIDERRDHWDGHDFSINAPRMEVKALTGWPFIFNFSFSRPSMYLLSRGDSKSVEYFTEKLIKELNYLGKNFSLKPSEIAVQATPAQVQALFDTVEPVTVTTAKKAVKKAVAKKAEPKKVGVKRTVKKTLLD